MCPIRNTVRKILQKPLFNHKYSFVIGGKQKWKNCARTWNYDQSKGYYYQFFVDRVRKKKIKPSESVLFFCSMTAPWNLSCNLKNMNFFETLPIHLAQLCKKSKSLKEDPRVSIYFDHGLRQNYDLHKHK